MANSRRWRFRASVISQTSAGLSSARKIRKGSISLIRGRVGKQETKYRARPGRRFHPDTASQPLSGRAADGQAHAGSGMLGAVQPPEHSEDIFEILGIDPDPI